MSTRQAEHRRHEIRVGLTILIGIVLIMLAILSLGEQRGLLEARYRLRVQMSNISGLQTGAPVRLAGVRVGSVTSIEFIGTKIEVTLEIDDEVQQRIRADSRAYIGTLGLLGDKYVGISMGSAAEAVLNDGDLLQSSEPIDVEKLLVDGVEILEVLKQTSGSINEITAKINRGEGTLGLLVNDPRMYIDLDRVLVLMENLSRRVESGKGTLARLFTDPGLYDRFVSVLHNMVVLTDSLRTGGGSLGRLFHDPVLFDQLAGAAAELNTIGRQLSSSDNSAGRLLNEPHLHDQLVRTTAELDSLIRDIRINPKKYLTIEIF